MAKTISITFSAGAKVANNFSRLQGSWHHSETVELADGDDPIEEQSKLEARVQARVDKNLIENGPSIDPDLFGGASVVFEGPEP